MKTPTQAQRKVLEALELGRLSGVYCTHYAVYGYGFTTVHRSATVRALDRAGWIEPIPANNRGNCFTITDLGRAAIARAALQKGPTS